MNFFNLIDPDISKIKGQVVSIIGGGGKTSLMQKIAEELLDENLDVILTTTTRIEPLESVCLVLQKDNPNFIAEIKALLMEMSIAMVASDYYKEGERLIGIDKIFVHKLKELADVVLVEADGSRQKGLKAHKKDEPVIPTNSDSVIMVCAADVVGAALNDDSVHRAALFSEKWSIPFNTALTPGIISQELISLNGYRKNIPQGASISILVNKSDLNFEGGKSLVENLVRYGDCKIFLGSLKENRLEQIVNG